MGAQRRLTLDRTSSIAGQIPTAGTWERAARRQIMLDMPATEPSRFLLFADSARMTAPVQPTKVRRYRLARLQPDRTRRDESVPRHEHLKRSYD